MNAHNETTVKAEDVFNAKDFQSIHLIIHFQNFTTNTEVRDTDKVTLQEVGDKQLVFEVPNTACNIRHSVMSSISIKVPGRNAPQPLIDVTGQILSVETLEGSATIRVTMKCVQYDEQSWAALLGIFATRQDEIVKFFESVRGY